MSKLKVNVKWLEGHSISLLYSEPVLYHCSYFNLYLQRTVEDAREYIPAEEILADGAEMAVYAMLKRLFEVNADFKTPEERFEVIAGIYKLNGFGLLPNLSDLKPDGGTVRTSVTHYSVAWKSIWGERQKPVDYFTCGFLRAAASIVFDKPAGTYDCVQTKCLTLGDSENVFEVKEAASPRKIPVSPGVGKIMEKIPDIQPVKTNVQVDEVTETVKTLPLEGNSQGLISAFGVYLTRHFANYYNYIVFETAKKMGEAVGDDQIARDLFIESGHICAFRTLGGIMTSPEWEGLVEPQCKNDDDWLSGIVAVMNALGWGRWCVREHDGDQKLVARVISDYEANGYLAMYGKSKHPISYFATGCSAGIMNLVYKGDIKSKPSLSDQFYSQIFEKEDSYAARQTKCRGMGDEICEITVEKP